MKLRTTGAVDYKRTFTCDSSHCLSSRYDDADHLTVTRPYQKHRQSFKCFPRPWKSAMLNDMPARGATTSSSSRKKPARATATAATPSRVTKKRGPGRPPKLNKAGSSLRRRSYTPPVNASKTATARPTSTAAAKTHGASAKTGSDDVKEKAGEKADKKKKTTTTSNDGDSSHKHPAKLMQEFFARKRGELGDLKYQAQQKKLGKMWRDSPLNPKNAATSRSEPAKDEVEEEVEDTTAGAEETDVEEADGEVETEMKKAEDGDE